MTNTHLAEDTSILNPRVLILAGGLSHERDVSLRSGRRVAESLRENGLDVKVSDVDASILPLLARGDIDVVWPLLHGAQGEDGAIRDVLELAGVPYVGSGPAACRMAWDKSVARTVAANAGLSVPDAIALPHSTFRELGAAWVLKSLVARLGLPLIVKPARGGSALGVTVVRSAEALPKAMVDCFAYGDVALLERHIEGVEVSVSVIDAARGLEVLPPVEIVADGGVYDYNARYTAGSTEFYCPARVPAINDVEKAALTAHRAFGLRHFSRTDLIVDRSGTVWFLEVNVAPGMTETSLLPQAVTAAGRSTAAVYRALVETALEDGSAPHG
jgi:D-alanine-D-alanine ligase